MPRLHPWSARIACGLAALACLAPSAGSGAAAMGVRSRPAPPGAEAPIVPDEVIVRFRPALPDAARAALLHELGLALRRPLGPERAYLLAITDGTAVPAMLERLRARAEVESAEPNRIARLDPPVPPQPIRKPE